MENTLNELMEKLSGGLANFLAAMETQRMVLESSIKAGIIPREKAAEIHNQLIDDLLEKINDSLRKIELNENEEDGGEAGI